MLRWNGAVSGRFGWFLIQNQLTSIDINGFNQLARRVAEVSRFKNFKDCDVIGSKEKVCL